MILHKSAVDSGFNTYIDYLALKRHFETDSYDYQKYRGKVKGSIDSFRTRPDAFFFQKLSKETESHEKLLANIIKNPKVWIRDIIDDNGEKVFLDWKKRIESLTYTFQQDLNKLDEDYKSNYVVSNGQHPRLMILYMQKQVSLETITILFHISKVSAYWEKEIVDKFIARDIMRLLRKYYPFLEIDEKKFSKIVKDRFF
jgi:hypothetical protein